MNKAQSFIALLLPPAQATNTKWNVPVSVCIAQAALETGWGSSVVGNNYFGIKATLTNGGTTVQTPTMEYENGKWVSIIGTFCRYTSLNQSAFEYGQFLNINPRYKPCFTTKTAAAFCTQLQECGYSTDPAYAAKLTAIISAHNLTQYDK